jgi:hypothetical protein
MEENKATDETQIKYGFKDGNSNPCFICVSSVALSCFEECNSRFCRNSCQSRCIRQV